MTADTAVTIVPASDATAPDLEAIFGTRGDAARCQCQHFKIRDRDWSAHSREELRERLREQTACGRPDSPSTSGLVAYLDGEPVGWCALEPRAEYARLRRMRTPWAGRDEDKDDRGVWALVCFVVRAGYRRRGISYALARAAVPFARERGATRLEGYPMDVDADTTITWGEMYVGHRRVFEAAGFREVTHPSQRRCVMVHDL
ncbi:acetyltransferase (GNAT) family protein [Mumia flava]|uniref:Acetyltransferase (GNAT) family protein n=1 Tax=Mumia flava TaxID=1348852 RepID=A0A0B2B7D8_9ACTN|nr:GNAT family N-acetyltransferase [Mumia flava]PJJ57783.1 acetyltransferase (GNAT) family protein [Mumia flava]